MLKISADLSTPLDICTEAIAWIGARGSGKTHGAGKLVELLLKAEVPVVILDPVGVWYGLRLAKDGKRAGLSIPVFGGLHGDVPLEATAGHLIADLICDKNISAVLDISQFDTDSQKSRFAADFIERLFMRRKRDPAVIHLVVEEAQEFIPQNPQPGEQMMLHRFHRYVKLGRVFGLGVSIVTQRPQEVSKKVLNQCQTVLAFRLTGPQERKAMKEWTSAHDLDQSLIEKLPSLETGNCHVWSPAFLKVSKEIRILPKETYDASATPKFGEHRASRPLAPIDLDKIREAMAAAIEKAKAEDPKELQRQVRDLTVKLAAKANIPVAMTNKAIHEAIAAVKPKVVEVPVLRGGEINRLEKLVARIEKHQDKVTSAGIEASALIVKINDSVSVFKGKPSICASITSTVRVDRNMPRDRVELRHPVTDRMQAVITNIGDGPAIGSSHRKIINSMAWLEQLGVAPCSRAQAAVFSGMTPNGGYYARLVGELKTAGHIVYPSSGDLELTDLGRKGSSPGSAPQSNEALHADVLGRLTASQRRILSEALMEYPNHITREHLAAKCEMDAAGGYFARLVGELKTMGLIDYPAKGNVRAAEILFIRGV